ncbi:phenylalanine--tRNA ligase subunit beta [Wenzhouxiangella marina]|uniref:Phenylalanine--tRNA ligase beta subunit n=1 Tax=Wenzhouxiangella marina TaxID=1579979 RepID=A0A0K0XWP2_9GAMM|nr:phenylalanine--tRNA ligase subunit beta [Wenzhouxiangella marina]AKS42036.1 phenylalanyl-tRNA synthetase [Wenzhouxiangella marina]MBB6086196.1 phenylalanyl-tRNA synthetase beta chain [Wenzhouxiangella marina]
MKVSYRWLKSWVPVELDAQAVAERFTLAGLEVDEVAAVAPPLDGVVVGEIVAIEPHPDADRLRVCRVQGDSEERTIVCGAPNARLGLKAPLATLGTTLPGGLKIKPAKLRGIRSEGMLCSEPELGLGEDGAGLMELPADVPTGAPLTEALGLDDHVLDIDLTPNRADALSVRGLARELSALTGVPQQPPTMAPVPAAIEDRPDIELLAPEDCPVYVGRIIRGIDAGAETPLWMVEALRRSGIRSLGPVVDVTNYVLLELGQPMHAFDLSRVNGGIRVRRAEAGEGMTLLDGRDIELDEDMLLITDHEGPLALAGIMGGEGSMVEEDTVDVLLESAWFNPEAIIGRARRLGLATESAHRFERGVDPKLQELACERATALILDIAGGQAGPLVSTVEAAHRPDSQPVRMRVPALNRLLGSEFSASEAGELLERLGMRVDTDGDTLTAIAPSARRDIEIEADLIEEVARVYGYDRLPTRRPGGGLSIHVASESELPEQRLRHQIAARGFQEILTWSFVGESELERLDLLEGAQALANPLNRDMAVLRTSLLPGLLNTAGANLRRQHADFRLFELGHCFRRGEEGLVETQRLGLLMTGASRAEHFSGKARALDFFDLKGEIEHLVELNAVAGALSFQPSAHSWLHPGQAAEVLLDGEQVGWLGQLHPALVERLDWAQTAFVAELDADRLSRKRLPEFRGLSRVPAVRRDLSLVVKDSVPAADLVGAVRELAGSMVEKCIIFDQYRGPGVESGSRSLSMGLIIRDVSRTLKDSDVDDLTAKVVEGLDARFDAKLRG